MPKDLRQFISLLKEQYPDDIAEVSRLVRPNRYEATAVLERLDREKKYPTVLFNSAENLLGGKSDFKLVSNVFGTRERCATILNFPREKAKMPLSLEFARRELSGIPAKTVSAGEAPVKANVAVGDAVDIRRLPIVRHFHMDVGPVLTLTCIMKDPDDGFYDISFIKTFYKGPRKVGISIHSPHHERILAKWEARGQRAPVVNVLGHHPAFLLGSLSLSPWGKNDYDSIGGFLDEPLRLVPSETWGKDFMVPADAEIIIEGEIIPGAREVVDPFGEVTRHYQAQCLRPIAEVTALSHRDNAILQDIFSGHQGHWNLGGLPKEGSIYNAVNQKFGGVKAVHMPYSGCGRFVCYVSVEKKVEGNAKIVGMEVLTHTPLMQWVVVVDEEIDPFDESDVMWAILTQTNPMRDVSVIQNARNFFTTAMGNTKVIIDATRPLDIAFPEKIKVPEDAVDSINLGEWLDKK
ncbi:MAG: UbiD family decarboxylase [Chloroflexi bacterium]|nr:UbiD family decarboxylase [Chloroflexota bacterium]